MQVKYNRLSIQTVNFVYISRENKISDPDGREQGLDARHLLQEREDWKLPQHPHPQPLHQGPSRRGRPLQHPHLSDLLLLHVPRPVPA